VSVYPRFLFFLLFCFAIYPNVISAQQSISVGTTQSSAEENVTEADNLTKQARAAWQISDLGEAEVCYQRALAIRERLAPGSVGLAEDLNGLGNVHERKGELDIAERYFRRALSKSPALSPELAVSLNGLGMVAEQRGQLVLEERLHRRAFAIQRKLDPNGLAFADGLAYLGRLAYFHHLYDKSEMYYKRSLSIREKLAPGSLDVASTLIALGTLAYARNQLAQAGDLYHRALDIGNKVAPNSLAIANFLSHLSPPAFDRGDLDEVERVEQQALAIEQKIAPEGLDMAVSLTRLGDVLEYRGNLVGAEQYYMHVLDIRRRLVPNSLAVAAILARLGIIAEDRGEFTNAEQYYRQSLSIQTKLAPGSMEVANTLNWLGQVAIDTGDLERAAQCLHQSIMITQRLDPSSLELAERYASLGRVASERGDVGEAEALLRRSLVISEKIAPQGVGAGEILNLLGEVLRQRHALAEAKECQLKALAIQQKLNPNSPAVAWTLHQLGKAESDSGELADAEDHLRQALMIQEHTVPGGVDQADILATLASVLEKKQELNQAAELYDRTLRILEKGVVHASANDSRSHSRFAEYSARYINLLMTMNQPENAFEVLERTHSRSLLEMLAEARVDVHKSFDPALLQQEHSLQQELTAKANLQLQLLNRKHASDEISGIQQEIDGVLVSYNAIEERLRETNPAYKALIEPVILDVKDVQQQLLDKDTVLLEYSLAEIQSYLWVVSCNSFTAYRLPGRSEIESLARRVYNLLIEPTRFAGNETAAVKEASLRKASAVYNIIASRLSRMLLGAAYWQLKGKRLMIVKDGALQYLPFAALPVPVTSIDWATAAPLLVEHDIVSLPSASVLAELRRQASGREMPKKEVAVLADPVYSQNDPRINGNTASHRSETWAVSSGSNSPLMRSARDLGLQSPGDPYLPRLPFSRREAAAILSVTPYGEGLQALDFAASRSLAISPALARYRIVHFATHGLLDNTHPELSGLVFSLFNQRGQSQEGYLDLQDIYHLSLPVDLVVLSACETALGKDVKGEGIVGLTRGFMYAGASRVMASLWRVDDSATAELMTRFYRALEKEQMSPAAALRYSQLLMWKQRRWSLPFYWAAFEIQGEWK